MSRLPKSNANEASELAREVFPADLDTDFWTSDSLGQEHRHIVLRSDKPFDIEDEAHAQRLSDQIKARIKGEVDYLLLFLSIATVKSDEGSFSSPLDYWKDPGFEPRHFGQSFGEGSGMSLQKECLYVKAIYRRQSARGIITLTLFGEGGSTILELFEYPK